MQSSYYTIRVINAISIIIPVSTEILKAFYAKVITYNFYKSILISPTALLVVNNVTYCISGLSELVQSNHTNSEKLENFLQPFAKLGRPKRGGRGERE